MKTYDPAIHEAPLVIGHAGDNDSTPAYGWIKGFAKQGNNLYADVAFTDALVNDGGTDAVTGDGALEASEQRALVQSGRGCGCSVGADPRGFGPLGGLGLGLWLVLRRRGRRAHSPSKAYS